MMMMILLFNIFSLRHYAGVVGSVFPQLYSPQFDPGGYPLMDEQWY